MHKTPLLLTLLIMVSVILGACAPATPTAAPNPTAPAVPAATQAGQAPEPTTASTGFQDIPREQTVIFENIDGRVAVPDNMNPYLANQYPDWGMWQANQESLFYLNFETGELVPWQAESYAYSPDYTTLTIVLRKGVTWSDGEPFTADDVVFTINMLKAHPELQYSSDMNQWVKDVQAKDPQTVVFTLTSANPRFLVSYFCVRIWETLLVAPKHIWENQDPVTFTNYDLENGWPVGTGPYKLVRSTETETVWDLRGNWWAADTGLHAMPAPKRAIWVGVQTEELRAAKVVNNELDAAWILGRSTYEQAVKQNPAIVAWTKDLPYAYLDACPRFLALNNGIPPFDNLDVRWAVNDAINRDDLVAIAYEGMTDPAETLYPTYPQLQAFLDRNAQLFQEYPIFVNDPAKSAERMTQAGFTRDNAGFWIGPDGQRVKFTIEIQSSETDKVKMGPVLVDQLTKAGFEVDFQALESAIYYDDTSKGKAQAFMSDVCASVTDPWNTFDRFHSRNYTPIGTEGPVNPAIRYKNPELDKLIDQMAVLPPEDPAFDPAADQALAIWVHDLPVVPLVQARLLTPFNNTYWTNWPTSDNNYYQPGHWWVTGGQILMEIKPAK
jgi:peptide/nickel transport system substrate-binding protein